MAAAALCAYVATLYISVAGGDSAELVTAAQTLSVAHPPGYPLYVLLTKAVLLMWPHGAPAFVANALSAVTGAAAAGILAEAAVVLAEGDAWAGILGGGLFAASPLVWKYSTHAEVQPTQPQPDPLTLVQRPWPRGRDPSTRIGSPHSRSHHK